MAILGDGQVAPPMPQQQQPLPKPQPRQSPNSGPPERDAYDVNIRIMIAAIVVLLCVIFFILALHLYAKWFWKSSPSRRRRRRSSSSSNSSFDFEFPHSPQQQVSFQDDPMFSNPAFGLDKSLLERLPTFIFDANAKSPSAVADCCAVCISEFQAGDQGRILPKCGHAFHTGCIDMWLYCHTTCPLCRAAIVSNPWEVKSKQQQQQQQQLAFDMQLLHGLVLTMPSSQATGEATPAVDIDQVVVPSDMIVGDAVIAAAAAVECCSSSSSTATSCCCNCVTTAPTTPRSPRSKWKSLRRMLSRDRRIAPSSSTACLDAPSTTTTQEQQQQHSLGRFQVQLVQDDDGDEQGDEQSQQQFVVVVE